MKGFSILLIAVACTLSAIAQNVEQVIKSDPLQLSGGVTNSSIWTNNKGSGTSAYSLYLSGNMNLNIAGFLNIPVSFAYTNRQLTKSCTSPFNRLSLSPQFKWIKAYIGYGSMSFSKYTMSGREFMGGGVELSPKDKWKIMAFGGRLQKAVEATEYADASLKMCGGGFLLGYNAENFSISANVIKVKEFSSSLPYSPSDSAYVVPRDNVAASLNARVNILHNLSLSGEYAMSFLSRMAEADSVNGAWFFDSHGDVITYHAGKTALAYKIPIGSVDLYYERIDPNYTTLGTYYNTDDFERIGLKSQLQIAEKLNVGANIGYQHDNLENQDVNSNSQFAYEVDLYIRPTEKLSVGLSASNNQEYVHVRDIIELVSQTHQYQNLDTLSYTE